MLPAQRSDSNFGFDMTQIKSFVAAAGLVAALSAGAALASTGTIQFADGGGVSMGLNGQTLTASVKTDYAGQGFTSAAAGSIGISGTLGTNGLLFSASIPAFLTTAALSNHSHGFSAGGGSSAFQTLSFSNGGGVTFTNTNGQVGATVATTYAASNHSHGNPTLALTNLSGTTASASNGLTLSLSAAAQTVQTQNLHNVTLSGNTSGAMAHISSGTMTLAGGNNITLSQNGNAVTISAGDAAPSPVNFSAGTTSGNLGSVVLSNSNGVSFGLNGSTITASVEGGHRRSYIEVMQGERLTSCAALSATQFSKRPMLMPFWFEGIGLQLKTVRFMVSGQSSSNRSFGGTFSAAIYSAANSSQLTLIGSDTMSFSITASSRGSLWNGMNIMDFTGMSGVSLSQEGRYVLGFAVAPVSANVTWMSAALWGGDNFPAISRFLVGNTTSATNNASHILPFWGVYSTTSNAMPGSIGVTQINGGNSASLVDAYAILKEI